MERDVLTLPEAANRLGASPATVRRWGRSGRIDAERVGGRYLLDLWDVEDLIEPLASVPPGASEEKARFTALVKAIRRHRGPL